MREILYGRQAVRESLRAGRRTPMHLYLIQGIAKMPIVDEITEMAVSQHVAITQLPRQEITHRTGTVDHQGVALETSGYPYVNIEAMIALAAYRQESPLLLLLDLIQDIHNLGSLVRTAEATGVHGVVIPERRAAGVTPAAVNASSGAFEHLLVSSVTNLAQEIDNLKRSDIWVAGLEDSPEAQLYTQIDMTLPLAIVIGSEGSGIRRLVRERCDWLMVIPMQGKINSLNAAVAGSVALYEAFNQRHTPG
jgi:23S rRNA (guanosine2251-2'-O)-methyltransferase